MLLAMQWLAALLISFIPTRIVSENTGFRLKECSLHDACAARLIEFGERLPEGSGWDPGSGQTPFYDDIFPEPELDYSNTIEERNFTLCECSENSTCPTEREDHAVDLDRTVRLSFCLPVSQILPSRCIGRRGLIRVMGEANEANMRYPVAIVKAIAFCRCPVGYKKLPAESWDSSHLSFPYKCS